MLLSLTSTEIGLQSKIESMIKYPEIQATLRPILEEGRKSIRFESANLELLQTTAAIFVGQGLYTTSEMTDIMQEAAIREGVAPETVEFKKPDKSYTDELRKLVDNQVRYLLPRDIEAREEAWNIAGIYSSEELEKIKETAAKNQEKEDKRIEDLRTKKEKVGQKREEAQTRLDELENGTGSSSSTPSLKDDRKALVSRLREGVNPDSIRPYSDEEVSADIGRTVSEALDEKDKAKASHDDEEQL